MYNITLVILGQRLKSIREYLKYTQAQLAEKLECKQNAISNLELGKGGSIALLFKLLNLYSDFVYIDLIFSEKFYLFSNNEKDEAKKASYTSVIAEIIQQSKGLYFERIESATELARKELDENMQRAIDLLNT